MAMGTGVCIGRAAALWSYQAILEYQYGMSTASPLTGGSKMTFIKRVRAGFKGFGRTIAAIPRDIRRYRSIKKM